MSDRRETVTDITLEMLWSMEIAWLEELADTDLADGWLAILDELASEGREDDKEQARAMLREFLWGE